ncbi:hypothetical protein F383_17907 [Gossypium arboreum]|uniref:Uncharacterized protein n=1 Tax=Gossypium arboreum TaxID=29729 RepID=A0A0B0MIL6_GOSAR|nr:hypothetical protein F383_17907 [Gossypium arboreum]
MLQILDSMLSPS